MDRSPLLRVNHLIAARENRQTILRLLQEQGTCSQRQLAQQTRLRASTMSYIIRDLTRWGFIEASGVIPTKRTGRKEVLLKLDGTRAWTAGVDLDRDSTELVIVNAAHEVLYRNTYELGYDTSAFFKSLVKELEQIKKELQLSDKRCLGMGVSVAGAVDAATGTVLKSVPLNLAAHPLGERFQEKFKLPVSVEHNAICGAFAEKLLGAAKPFNHFILFLMRPAAPPGHAYSVALFLNGAFYRGAHSSAGELDVLLTPLSRSEAGSSKSDGEPTHDLTHVIASLSNLFDPQAVILFADEKFRGQLSLPNLDARVQELLIKVPGRRIPLHWNQLQSNTLAYGAALMQLHQGMSSLLTSLVE